MPTSPRPEAFDWQAPVTEPADSVLLLDDHPDLTEPAADRGLDEAERRGTEYSAAPGMPGRGIILASAAAGLGTAALDVALTGGLTLFFDLCFIVICLVGAMAVRPHDLFTTGVLAPLVFGGVIGTVAVADPGLLAPGVGYAQAFLTGLAHHATALVAGYAIALLTVAGRVATRRQRSTG